VEIIKPREGRDSPAIGLCECGKKVVLLGFTNTCECNRDYNVCGQLLAPRGQWGEETGESASDILNYDYENAPEVDY
jgi:hypothetical protein